MAEQNPLDENNEKEVTLSENDPSKGIFPESIGDTLKIETDAVKNGEADVSWDEWDKSFDAQTDGFKAAGFIVFGYLDGRGKFYPANSKKNVFEICEDTDDVEIIAYNPRPIKVNVKVAGFDKNTGRPTFGLDEESPEGGVT